MSDVQFIGRNTSTDTPVRRLTLFGNALATAGSSNLNGVTFTVIGGVFDYHRHRTVNGLDGGFAGISNHGHNEINVWNATEDNLMSSILYTADSTSSSHIGYVMPRAATGAAVANEIAINTSATSPTGPNFTGRVLLEFSGTSTGITNGQRIVLVIQTAMVAGIEAASYPGIVTSVTNPGGNTTIEIEIDGLDAQHWNASAAGRVTTLNSLWSLQPISAAIANTTSISPVSGQSEVDIVFSSVPSDVVVGRQVSLWITPTCLTTVSQTNTLIPASILSITGTTVRVRARNMRWRQNYNFGGSTDTDTSRFSLHLGVADPAHEPTMGGVSWSVWRSATTGAVVAGAVGPSDVASGADGSFACGIGIVARSANVFRFGTNDTSNVGQLSGNVLTVSQFSTGTARWSSGAGTPEGAVTAPVGSLYTRTDGGAGTTLYVKESGTGNTGWVAK